MEGWLGVAVNCCGLNCCGLNDFQIGELCVQARALLARNLERFLEPLLLFVA